MKMWMHRILKTMAPRIVSANGTYRFARRSSAGTICSRKSTTYKRETKIAPRNCPATPVGGGRGPYLRHSSSSIKSPNIVEIRPALCRLRRDRQSLQKESEASQTEDSREDAGGKMSQESAGYSANAVEATQAQPAWVWP